MRETIITSSVLILCIALIRKLCKGRISACLQYALWLIVAVRLIVPAMTVVFPNILPESNLSIMNVADRMAVVANTEAADNYDITSGGLPFLSSETERGTIADFFASGVISSWADFFKGIWYLGIVVVGAWMIAVNIVFMHKLRKSRIRYEKEEFELPIPLPVYLAKNLPSPCLYGLPGRQAIYLSEDAIDDENKVKHILAHEYCHYKHRDIFWSALRCVIVAVYWFHPLVWVAAVMSKQDCELACDESAIKLLGEEERVAYGKTLVSLITRKTKASDIVCAATTMTGGIEGVKERVSRIAKKPRRLMIVLIPVAVIVCAAAVLTFTQAKEEPDGVYILEGESSLTVTTECFQVVFPDYFANKAYYRSENGTDIIVFQKDSNREIGRFCRLSYEEAAKLADEKEVILIGNYGSNRALASYIENGYVIESDESIVIIDDNSETMHEYTPLETPIEHEYIPTEIESNSVTEREYIPAESTEGAGGVPGTDSNTNSDYEDTTYILSDSVVGMNPIPAPEEVDKEWIELPYDNLAHVESAVGTDSNVTEQHTYIPYEDSTDYLPTEIVPEEQMHDDDFTEVYHEYLPIERVVTTEKVTETFHPSETADYCYLYVPADNSDADVNVQEKLSEMNQKLVELTYSVSVLSVSEESMQKMLDIMMENRMPYIEESLKISHMAAAIPTTAAMYYKSLSMHYMSGERPDTVTLNYNLNGNHSTADSDMQFMVAVLMFASIENLTQCNVQITDVNNPTLIEAITEYQYTREEMEELFGPLYPCSETKEDFVDLYNRVLEYLETSEE
ncbi:MAG: M56 family metallopeptidase [Lachnospiraceae bacterium]|nr:M56 family metallopeptidase [Lachnospiraceae bacterium]